MVPPCLLLAANVKKDEPHLKLDQMITRKCGDLLKETILCKETDNIDIGIDLMHIV